MRAFKEPNLTGDWKCPICGTDDKKEVVLVGVQGTEDGGIIEAEQIHLDCIELTYAKETLDEDNLDGHESVLYQSFIQKEL